jgi:hypothetical protein
MLEWQQLTENTIYSGQPLPAEEVYRLAFRMARLRWDKNREVGLHARPFPRT